MSDSNTTPTTTRVRPDVITDRFLVTLRSHEVVSAYLFGSVARGEERPDSDLDLLVAFGDGGSFADQLHLSEDLERLCRRRVDVLTQIHPAFAPYIEPTLIPIPL